jgi:hypothetical protein
LVHYKPHSKKEFLFELLVGANEERDGARSPAGAVGQTRLPKAALSWHIRN